MIGISYNTPIPATTGLDLIQHIAAQVLPDAVIAGSMFENNIWVDQIQAGKFYVILDLSQYSEQVNFRPDLYKHSVQVSCPVFFLIQTNLEQDYSVALREGKIHANNFLAFMSVEEQIVSPITGTTSLGNLLPIVGAFDANLSGWMLNLTFTIEPKDFCRPYCCADYVQYCQPSKEC